VPWSFKPFWSPVLTRIPKDVIRLEPLPAVDMECVYQTLERMPYLWQGAEYPLDTILTTYGILIIFFHCKSETSLVAILLRLPVLSPGTLCDPTS
jgi:hypothetical protein